MRGLEFLQDIAARAPEHLCRYAMNWQKQFIFGPDSVARQTRVLNAYANFIPLIRNNILLTVNDIKTIQRACAAQCSPEINFRHTIQEEEYMQRILTHLYAELASSGSKEDHLFIIALAVKKLEQIDSFHAANSRIFFVVFINILLLQNDFLPTLIDIPHNFDKYDCNSLVIHIKKGIERSEVLKTYITTRSLSALSVTLVAQNWCDILYEQKLMLINLSAGLKDALLVGSTLKLATMRANTLSVGLFKPEASSTFMALEPAVNKSYDVSN